MQLQGLLLSAMSGMEAHFDMNMNKNTIKLVKDYITKTLDEPNGISTEAYQALSSLMQEDREFAMEMHDIVALIATSKGRYFLLEENALDELDGYEL
jgi:hypothetical protein